MVESWLTQVSLAEPSLHNATRVFSGRCCVLRGMSAGTPALGLAQLTQAKAVFQKAWRGKRKPGNIIRPLYKAVVPCALNMASEPCHCRPAAEGCRPKQPRGGPEVRQHQAGNGSCLNPELWFQTAPAGWVPSAQPQESRAGLGDHLDPALSSPCLHPPLSKVSRSRSICDLMSLNQSNRMSFAVDFSGT